MVVGGFNRVTRDPDGSFRTTFVGAGGDGPIQATSMPSSSSLTDRQKAALALGALAAVAVLTGE